MRMSSGLLPLKKVALGLTGEMAPTPEQIAEGQRRVLDVFRAIHLGEDATLTRRMEKLPGDLGIRIDELAKRPVFSNVREVREHLEQTPPLIVATEIDVLDELANALDSEASRRFAQLVGR